MITTNFPYIITSYNRCCHSNWASLAYTAPDSWGMGFQIWGWFCIAASPPHLPKYESIDLVWVFLLSFQLMLILLIQEQRSENYHFRGFSDETCWAQADKPSSFTDIHYQVMRFPAETKPLILRKQKVTMLQFMLRYTWLTQLLPDPTFRGGWRKMIVN